MLILVFIMVVGGVSLETGLQFIGSEMLAWIGALGTFLLATSDHLYKRLLAIVTGIITIVIIVTYNMSLYTYFNNF